MFSTMLSPFLSFTIEVLDFEQAELSNFFHLCNGFNELSFRIENVGSAVACSVEMSPLDYFLLFVDNHMLTSIVRETNRFAIQCLTANGKDPNS